MGLSCYLFCNRGDNCRGRCEARLGAGREGFAWVGAGVNRVTFASLKGYLELR